MRKIYNDVTFIDTSASMAVEEIFVNASDLGLEVILIGISGGVKETLERLDVTDVIPPGHSFDTRLHALQHAAKLLEAGET